MSDTPVPSSDIFVDQWIEPTDLKHAETEASPDLGKTQPLLPPTTSNILEIFTHFQDKIFERLDRRDENMLHAIRDIGTTMLEHYERTTSRVDDHAEWIRRLRTRTHAHSTDIQAIVLRVAELERATKPGGA